MDEWVKNSFGWSTTFGWEERWAWEKLTLCTTNNKRNCFFAHSPKFLSNFDSKLGRATIILHVSVCLPIFDQGCAKRRPPFTIRCSTVFRITDHSLPIISSSRIRQTNTAILNCSTIVPLVVVVNYLLISSAAVNNVATAVTFKGFRGVNLKQTNPPDCYDSRVRHSKEYTYSNHNNRH